MTREEIMNMNAEELETRAAEIATEAAEADAEQIETLNAEIDMIEERKNAIKEEMETRAAKVKAVMKKSGSVIESGEERKEESKMVEVRNTKEYLDAYAEYLKTGDDTECRALLTENAEDGTIAIPTYVEDKINTAWESNELMRLVRRTYFKGNLKVGYEVSAEPPIEHAEGGNAITEENLVINYVELIPGMMKKMVRVSDEVMDMRGQAFLDYIFDEIEYQIVKSLADSLVYGAASGTVGALIAEYEAAGASLTTADIVGAQGLLGAEASNPILFTTRATAAALKASALSANYGYDPFDGMDVIYVDSNALSGGFAVIADPSAFQINLPNGDGVQFKFDDITEAAADMVRVIGRLYAAGGIVAPGRVVRIVEGQ